MQTYLEYNIIMLHGNDLIRAFRLIKFDIVRLRALTKTLGKQRIFFSTSIGVCKTAKTISGPIYATANNEQ